MDDSDRDRLIIISRTGSISSSRSDSSSRSSGTAASWTLVDDDQRESGHAGADQTEAIADDDDDDESIDDDDDHSIDTDHEDEQRDSDEDEMASEGQVDDEDEDDDEDDDDSVSIVDVQDALDAQEEIENADNVTRLFDEIADRDASLFQLYNSQMQTFIYNKSNYLFTNTRLTLVLTIITAAIVGIAVGHFIGSTAHFWIRRAGAIGDHQFGDYCMQRVPSMPPSSLQYWKVGADWTCDRERQPIKTTSELDKCHQELIDVQSAYRLKATINRYIQHSTSRQHQQLRSPPQFIYDNMTIPLGSMPPVVVSRSSHHRSSTTPRRLYASMRYRLRNAEHRLAIAQYTIDMQANEMMAQRAMTHRLVATEAAYRRRLAECNFESMDALNRLQASQTNRRSLQNALKTCRQKMRASSPTKIDYSPINCLWNSALSANNNFTRMLDDYLRAARRLYVPTSVWDIAEPSQRIVIDQLQQIQTIFGELQSSLRSRLRDVDEIVSADKIDRLFIDMRDAMGTALTRVWHHTERVASHVVDHLSDPKTHKQHLALINSIADQVHSSLPASFDQSFQLIKDVYDHNTWLHLVPSQLKPPPTTDDKVELIGRATTTAIASSSTPRIIDPLCDRLDAFATALDRAHLAGIIGRVPTRIYIDDRLRSIGCTRRPTRAQLHYIDCQKCWWTGDCTTVAYPNVECEWEPWQRSYRLSARRFLDDHPMVREVMAGELQWMPTSPTLARGYPLCATNGDDIGYCDANRSTNPPQPSNAHYRTLPSPANWQLERGRVRQSQRDREHAADWHFERYLIRQQRRQMTTSADWMFERGKQRAEHRRGNASSGGGTKPKHHEHRRGGSKRDMDCL